MDPFTPLMNCQAAQALRKLALWEVEVAVGVSGRVGISKRSAGRQRLRMDADGGQRSQLMDLWM